MSPVNSGLTQVASCALSHYDLADAQPALLDNTSNVVFRVLPPEEETGANTGFVLRVHASGARTTQAILEELQWLSAIRRETDLIVPAPVPARDGSLIQEIPAPGESVPRQCVLFQWIPGKFRNENLTPDDLRRVGAFMARLHCHSERFVASQASPPTRRAVFCDAHAPDKAATHFSAEDLAVFEAAAQWVHKAVEELGEDRDVFGFIHGDLHQWNYLFHGNEVRAIDFDDCGWGYYAYDMAVPLSYLEDQKTFPALQEAFLAGYQQIRPLPRRFADYLDVFLAARILVMLPWILGWPHPNHISWGPRFLQQASGRLRRYLERKP
ncbi:MAG TPA: phosphotransferase [Thermoanaerobaculia bacterium]|jgi:Ser/Thr protein kinase RdoA (MazF antagonist)|nr:phosphotransferase [Thermoanaerobaculia bacterium]